MKEVNKEDFYKEIGPLNVQLSVTGEFPYTTEFLLRNRTLAGKVIQKYSDEVKKHYPIITKYFLTA